MCTLEGKITYNLKKNQNQKIHELVLSIYEFILLISYSFLTTPTRLAGEKGCLGIVVVSDFLFDVWF